MVFSSEIFIFAFLPVVFVLYRLVPSRGLKNAFLALASLIFYCFGQVEYLPLLLASVLINYIFGALLGGSRARRALLAAAVALNIGILCVFKYLDFFIGAFDTLFTADIPSTGIVLPIGISFFTFQGLSYVIDVYRDRELSTKNFLSILLYISFFPQLIAGPIVKYHDVSLQLTGRVCGPELTLSGIRRFCVGLAKKLLLANTLGAAADAVFALAPSALDTRLAWLGAVCYTMQIYFDFSGYSDMAIGLGRMFGFKFLENFNYPYISKSIREFWRRWHISLSGWFRDYLYIPLGGSRRGRGRTLLNLSVVFLLTGLWHGASWTFVLWGLWHGLFCVLERAGAVPVKKLSENAFGSLALRAYALLVVVFGFVMFRAESVGAGFAVIASMLGAGSRTAESALAFREIFSGALMAALALGAVFSTPVAPYLLKRLQGAPPLVLRLSGAACCLLCAGLLLLSVMSLSAGGFNPFIYFQF